MSALEVILVLLGLAIFVASFVIPESKKKLQKDDVKLGEEKIRELVDVQMKDAKDQLSDVVQETVTYAVEKSERGLERLTNEKIQAVNEYSSTVLDEIHKNHEEVVFLYDMLNDKHKSLTEVVAEAEVTASRVRQKVQDAPSVQESVQIRQEVQAAPPMQKSVQVQREEPLALVEDFADDLSAKTEAAPIAAKSTPEKVPEKTPTKSAGAKRKVSPAKADVMAGEEEKPAAKAAPAPFP